ncbi:monoterpene synthase TPS4, chloroplastic-like [Diospyros lotus]|uniref:monoterpene synthase TPS4, chloroplastic-like n=1 Tax=Diospyros lotus TaxID=55363 RepID=UPI00225AB16A|nr:monoterpene synthase TPS4, chloroplastic-like [Diospyros lotus]
MGIISKEVMDNHSLDTCMALPLQALALKVDDRTRMKDLEERARMALREASSDTASIMKLIDTMQRLGLGDHFEQEINTILQAFSDSNLDQEDLFTTALCFRLLRQNGYQISTNVFQRFMDNSGAFKQLLSKDIEGLLSLYEASHLGACGESVLLQAMEFTKTHLRQSIPFTENGDGKHVLEAIELPRHLRMVRLEARRFIEEYSKRSDQNSYLLELAKLEYNKVQALHQSELAEVTSWWEELGLAKKLSFARDRPLECYFWTVGILPEPKYSDCRIELAKTIAILLVIDDMYDSYAPLDELVIFTEAIRRWDLSAMEQLPEYMKICYMALYNTNNEIGYKILRKHRRNAIPHLKRTWIDMMEAYLVEAKWFNEGYVPKLEEYLENGVTTAGSYMALVHLFFLIGEGVTEETIGMMDPYPKLFSSAGRILRLWDDLGTATEEQERGDVASSIDCIIREKNLSSEGEARNLIKQLVQSLWKDLGNELVAPKALPLPVIRCSLNMSRTSQVVYQHGDDNKFPSVDDCVKSLFFTPISF